MSKENDHFVWNLQNGPIAFLALMACLMRRGDEKKKLSDQEYHTDR